MPPTKLNTARGGIGAAISSLSAPLPWVYSPAETPSQERAIAAAAVTVVTTIAADAMRDIARTDRDDGIDVARSRPVA